VRAARARFFGLTLWWLPAQDRRWGRSPRLSTSPFRCSYDLSCRRARLAEGPSPVAAGGLLSRSFRLSDSRSRVSWIDTITDGHRRTRRRPQGRPPCLVTCRFVAHGWRVRPRPPGGSVGSRARRDRRCRGSWQARDVGRECEGGRRQPGATQDQAEGARAASPGRQRPRARRRSAAGDPRHSWLSW
jgi:hypothetical protein